MTCPDFVSMVSMDDFLNVILASLCFVVMKNEIVYRSFDQPLNDGKDFYKI